MLLIILLYKIIIEIQIKFDKILRIKFQCYYCNHYFHFCT